MIILGCTITRVGYCIVILVFCRELVCIRDDGREDQCPPDVCCCAEGGTRSRPARPEEKIRTSRKVSCRRMPRNRL